MIRSLDSFHVKTHRSTKDWDRRKRVNSTKYESETEEKLERLSMQGAAISNSS